MDQPSIIQHLNRLLANYFVLSIKLFRYKHYAKGAHTFSNRQLFHTFRTEIDQEIEELTSFIASSGGKPFAIMSKFIKESTIEEATADDEEEEMITQLVNDFTVINKQMEELVSDADELVKYFLSNLQRRLLERRHICIQLRE